MNKFILLFLLLFCSVSYSQVVLKGINLGGYNDDNEIVTTVGGLPGVILLDKMKNGKIWKITFSSTKSYRSHDNKFDQIGFYNDLRELINGIEENYEISFKNSNLNLDKIIEVRSLNFTASKNGVEYSITTDSERRNFKEWISFSLRSNRLDQINRNENPNKHDY